MTDSIIPVGLRLFILENIDSIAELEALLLLYHERAQTWDDAAIAKRLYVSSDIVRTILAKLERLDLITCVDNQVRFECRASAEREQLIALLAYHYAHHLIPVTKLVHEKASRISQFANAFKLKKD